MCKVAILDPSRLEAEQIADAAHKIYLSQRSGFGVVSVQDSGDKFDYSVMKWVSPTEDQIRKFIVSQVERNDVEFFILHGRLATSGSRDSLSDTHPIEVDCPECDIDYVLHNGVYSNSYIKTQIEELADDGHQFTTKVDTELMAHKIGAVPETLENADERLKNSGAGYEQAVILLNEDRIFIYSDRKYRIDENVEMYMTHEKYMNPDAEKNYSMVIMVPGGEE